MIVTLLVDSREKRPLSFPSHVRLYGPNGVPTVARIEPVTQTLERGDYRGSDPLGTVVERKAGIAELSHNLSAADRPRFLRALDRLAECRYPILLLEGNPQGLLSPTEQIREPGLIVDELVRILRERAIALHVLPTSTLPQRRAAGEWVARMIASDRRAPKNPTPPFTGTGDGDTLGAAVPTPDRAEGDMRE